MTLTPALQAKQDLIAVLATMGEAITFRPKRGGPRSVTAILTRDETPRDVSSGHQHEELVRTTVLRDASEALGGIDAPELGDVITIDDDPEQRAFAFTGGVFNKSLHGWSLEWKCTRTKRFGQLNVAQTS